MGVASAVGAVTVDGVSGDGFEHAATASAMTSGTERGAAIGGSYLREFASLLLGSGAAPTRVERLLFTSDADGNDATGIHPDLRAGYRRGRHPLGLGPLPPWTIFEALN